MGHAGFCPSTVQGGFLDLLLHANLKGAIQGALKGLHNVLANQAVSMVGPGLVVLGWLVVRAL